MELKEYKIKIENKLRDYFDNLILPTKDKYVVETVKNLKEFTLRPAKRLRPILITAAYKCFKDDDEIIFPSLSIELMQSFLLIHDDIIDEDDLRRGKKTIHKIYAEKGGNYHYGISMGINVGDISGALISDPIFNSNFSDDKKTIAVRELNGIYLEEICGQIMDTNDIEDNSLERLKETYLLKTVAYTTRGPLKLGCIFAGEYYYDFSNYAIPLGLAFQIKNDLLGIFGNEEETGKSNSSDIRKGKITYPIQYTIDNCDEEKKDFILRNLGKKDLNEDEIDEIKKIVKETSLDEINKIIFNYIKQAKESLDLNLKKEGLETLIKIAELVEKRIN